MPLCRRCSVLSTAQTPASAATPPTSGLPSTTMEPSWLDFHVLYCQNTDSLVRPHFQALNLCYSRLLHWSMQGMSAFYYAASFFNNSGIELHNLTNFTATVQVFCNLTNTTVRITALCSMQQLAKKNSMLIMRCHHFSKSGFSVWLCWKQALIWLSLQALSWHHEDSYFQERCFNGIFSLFLLQTGFGFNNSNSHWTLKFEKKVSVGSVALCLPIDPLHI